MNRRNTVFAKIALVASLAMLPPAFIAAPASAEPSIDIMDRDAGANNDWADEGPLGGSSFSRSGAAGTWQAFLYSRGLLPWSGVDCIYGPKTIEATKTFQRRNGLSPDGQAGPRTLGKADNMFTVSGGEVYSGSGNRRVKLTIGSEYVFQGVGLVRSTYYRGIPPHCGI